jgi:hypothetical protein
MSCQGQVLAGSPGHRRRYGPAARSCRSHQLRVFTSPRSVIPRPPLSTRLPPRPRSRPGRVRSKRRTWVITLPSGSRSVSFDEGCPLPHSGFGWVWFSLPSGSLPFLSGRGRIDGRYGRCSDPCRTVAISLPSGSLPISFQTSVRRLRTSAFPVVHLDISHSLINRQRFNTAGVSLPSGSRGFLSQRDARSSVKPPKR